MAHSPQSFLIPYRTLGQDPQRRPYLVMEVTGINGRSGPVLGLVDTGADTTSFPAAYAVLMGYDPTTLTAQTIGQAAGSAQALLATVPSHMKVPEVPDVIIDTRPLFVPGSPTVLWGRRDFMAAFDIMIMESDQQFTIQAKRGVTAALPQEAG